jgi:hypothetical protein
MRLKEWHPPPVDYDIVMLKRPREGHAKAPLRFAAVVHSPEVCRQGRTYSGAVWAGSRLALLPSPPWLNEPIADEAVNRPDFVWGLRAITDRYPFTLGRPFLIVRITQ